MLIAIGYDPTLTTDRVQVTTGSEVEFAPQVELQRLTAIGQERYSLQVLGHTLPPQPIIRSLFSSYVGGAGPNGPLATLGRRLYWTSPVLLRPASVVDPDLLRITYATMRVFIGLFIVCSLFAGDQKVGKGKVPAVPILPKAGIKTPGVQIPFADLKAEAELPAPDKPAWMFFNQSLYAPAKDHLDKIDVRDPIRLATR